MLEKEYAKFKSDLALTSKSIWSTMWIIEPPPSQGRIRKPLGSISALTKLEGGGPVGPPVEEVNDLSHICKCDFEIVSHTAVTWMITVFKFK